MLSRDKILGYRDDRIGRLDVPDLGGEVGLARLTVAEADRLAKLDSGASANLELLILGVCDDEGKRLFSDKDRDALKKLPNDVVRMVAQAILTHNGYTGEEKNASGETES